MLSAEHVQSVADIFRVLGDPTRVKILDALEDGERCVNDLAAKIGMTESAVSHQLRLLRDRRLVTVRREGKRTYYRLQDEHIRTLVDMGMSHAVEDGLLARPTSRVPAAARRSR